MRVVLAIGLLVALIAAPSTASACGYPKKKLPPQCQPAPTPVPPTPVPATPVPPPPTPAPPVIMPTPPSATATPVAPVVVTVPSATATPSAVQNSRRRDVWCHYEASTGLWELRPWGKSAESDRQPMSNGLCEQEQAQPVPTATAVPAETAPTIEYVAPEIVQPQPEATPEMPPAPEASEVAPEATPEAEQTPEEQPEVELPTAPSPEFVVPAQIPPE